MSKTTISEKLVRAYGDSVADIYGELPVMDDKEFNVLDKEIEDNRKAILEHIKELEESKRGMLNHLRNRRDERSLWKETASTIEGAQYEADITWLDSVIKNYDN